ncbi:terminase large subunit [Clostridium perfringens]|uniref:terminase large subunit n=1 Tax=Clostridium perfringens TaxID=1502 RepID=UPI0024BCAAAC|nr:terminase TerL endonuclease subunit [Clostridium perfringens]MDU2085994.1 terminase TerL endonuclease subunit [Clostridium perfringens]MDU8977176.1 terminase TerL endonuclease subunit [Clostridium perfringens]
MSGEELFGIIYTYAEEVVNGKVVACEKHKWACKRFIEDINKIQKEEFPYYFDLDEVLDFYEWARLFKHRTGIVKGQRIEIIPWQLFIAGNLFGWKNKKTDFRRFKKAFISVGRKNAKSELLSLIATYECFITDDNSEIYLTGWNKDGSDIVYREINYHLSHPYEKDFFKGKYKTAYGKITHLKSGSFIQPLSREAKNTDNANNPSLAIVDEYKDHVTSEIYDNLNTGMTRPNALIVIISTAGTNINCPMMFEYKYVSKVLNPDIKDVENDEYFIMICELEKDDDIKDEKVWPKANPIVTLTEFGMEKLRGDLKVALDAPEKMRIFKTKNMNIWCDDREDGYMNMEKWEKAETEKTLEDFTGEPCILGVDLSTKLDLTSISFEFFLDGEYYTFQHSWIPDEAYQRRLREGKYRFDLWVEEGNLTVCPGAVIDYGYVKEYFQDIERKYKIKILEIAYDPMNATQFIQELEFEGYVCVEVRQGPFTLNEPTKDYRDKLYEGKVKHGKDGLYSWSASNAVATQHKQEYIMLDKKKSHEKIDPMAATINAHYRATKKLQVITGDIFYSPPI